MLQQVKTLVDMASHIEIRSFSFFPSSPMKDIFSWVELTKLGDTVGSLKHPYTEKKTKTNISR